MSANGALFKVNGSEDAVVEAQAVQVAQQYDLGHEADFASYRVEPPTSELPDEVNFAINDLIATCDSPELVPDSQDDQPAIWRPIKRALHRLITYYVNRSATRQEAFNASALRAVNMLATRLAASQAEVKQLTKEVESLRK